MSKAFISALNPAFATAKILSYGCSRAWLF